MSCFVSIDEGPVLARAPVLPKDAVGWGLHRRVEDEVGKVEVVEVDHKLANQAVGHLSACDGHLIQNCNRLLQHAYQAVEDEAGGWNVEQLLAFHQLLAVAHIFDWAEVGNLETPFLLFAFLGPAVVFRAAGRKRDPARFRLASRF